MMKAVLGTKKKKNKGKKAGMVRCKKVGGLFEM